MAKEIDRAVKKIFNTKKINSYKDLKAIAEYWEENFLTYDDVKDFINILEFNFPIDPKHKEEIFRTILSDNSIQYDFGGEDLVIYDDEYDYIMSGKEHGISKILFAFLINSKIHPHESGWVKYEKEEILKLVDEKLCNKTRILLEKCLNGFLDISVIGSKNPIICYKIAIAKNENHKIAFTVGRYENFSDIYKEKFGEKNE